MKVVFMGTPDFAIPALSALLAADCQIMAVYTKPPSAAGRGKHHRYSPVYDFAKQHQLPVETPRSLKLPDVEQQLSAFSPDYVVVVAYGLMLPDFVLSLCPCVNIHASLLPRWRGAAPIQRAILAGDSTAGVTTMLMDAGLDTGDVLLQQTLPITEHMTAGQLHDGLSQLGAALIVPTLESLRDGTIAGKKQLGVVRYAHKITKEEARINWHESVAQVQRQIRAFNPFPGAYLMIDGVKIKIFTAKVKNAAITAPPGTILDDTLTIACKDGVVLPQQVQRQGRTVMGVAEMLRGFKIMPGTCVES